MTHAPRDLVRAELRSLLEASPAYQRLPAPQRRALAQGLVRLGTYLVEDPRWLGRPAPAPAVDEALAPLRQQLGAPPLARGLDQGTGSSFVAGASNAGTQSFSKLVGSVDFSEFVSGLIQGVFKAIVDASIEQMKAYQELVSAAVSGLSQLENAISDQDSGNYLNNQYPGAFDMSSGSLQLADGSSPPDALFKDLGLPAASSLPEMQVAARLKMAQERQQTLASIIVMGINRIVVTDGRINARVLFDVTAKDDASDERSSDTTRSDTHTRTTKSKSFWGTSNTTDTQSSSVTVRTSSSAKDAAELAVHAQLSGEVSVNFKSETFPLERLAAGRDIQRLQNRSQPAPRG